MKKYKEYGIYRTYTLFEIPMEQVLYLTIPELKHKIKKLLPFI
jgi:hypothetical protein